MGARWPVEVGQVQNMDLGSDSGGMLRSQWVDSKKLAVCGDELDQCERAEL